MLIAAGVGLASLKELSFSWTALIAASCANQVTTSLLLTCWLFVFTRDFKLFVFVLL